MAIDKIKEYLASPDIEIVQLGMNMLRTENMRVADAYVMIQATLNHTFIVKPAQNAKSIDDLSIITRAPPERSFTIHTGPGGKALFEQALKKWANNPK